MLLRVGLLEVALLVVLVDRLFHSLCKVVVVASRLRRREGLRVLAVNGDFAWLVTSAGAEGSLAVKARWKGCGGRGTGSFGGASVWVVVHSLPLL